jgi:DNA-binding GntR family transcriptional regulator
MVRAAECTEKDIMTTQSQPQFSVRPPVTKAAKESSTDRFQRIYRQIRERICLLHYPPGTVLNETALATEFGVSRTPLRRVLQQLNHEGLVEIKNGVGTIVTDINMKTFKDIYDLRGILRNTQVLLMISRRYSLI